MLLLNSCGTPTGHVDTKRVAYKSPNIKIMNNLPRNAEIINTVSVITCHYDNRDPKPTPAQVNNLLTNEANKLGADGISNIRIWDPGTPLMTDCWSRLAGEATAFKFKSGTSYSDEESEISFNIKEKKQQCEVIGFKPETEKFADCVLRLVELDIQDQSQNQISMAQNSGNDALVKQLERRNNLESSQALINLGQQLMQPKTYNSNVYLPQTQRCTIQGFGTFAKMTCR